MGASDPESGIAVMLEVARLFGKMYGQGWRPKRTLEFAAWDGEEYGLLGSTNYVDTNLSSLTGTACCVVFLYNLLCVLGIDGGGKEHEQTVSDVVEQIRYWRM